MNTTLPFGIMIALAVGACGDKDEPHGTATETTETAGTMEEVGKTMDETMEKATDATATALRTAVMHTKVRAQLLDGIGADALRINIDVEGDRIVLMGTVTEKANLELAKEMVEAVDGVKSVESKLALKPKSSDEPGVLDTAKAEFADATLHAKVRMALLDKLGSDALKIDIDVAEGNVVLSGAVMSDESIAAASKVVEGMDNVKGVENELKSGA